MARTVQVLMVSPGEAISGTAGIAGLGWARNDPMGHGRQRRVWQAMVR